MSRDRLFAPRKIWSIQGKLTQRMEPESRGCQACANLPRPIPGMGKQFVRSDKIIRLDKIILAIAHKTRATDPR